MRTGADVPEERIETTAAVVRVKCPPRASPAEFVALIRAWVDHQCILLADFKGVSEANAEGLFDAAFVNPRDAKLFARRFAGQLILPHTSPRTGRNSPGRLIQFRGRLKAKKDAHLFDQGASAIATSRAP